MREAITERLERYTDLPYELIQDITRQVMIALDADNAPNIVVMDEYDYDAELEKAENKGHRVGYMDALDMIVDDIDGLEISDIEAYCHEKKSAYLDKV